VELTNRTLEEFSEILGSDSPAPGGGSVSALSGALAADLISMVCSLSRGKEEYAGYDSLLAETYDKVNTLSKGLLKRVELDSEAFDSVMTAFRMPKSTDEEKAARKEAIRRGFKEAVQSPLGIARDCIEVLRAAEPLFGKFNTNAISDFGVAGQLAHTGLEGAVMNVRINLPSIKDEQYIAEMKTTVAELLEEGASIRARIYAYVGENIG
jgi:formiminotetrahydrofolate cyclodeaminase